MQQSKILVTGGSGLLGAHLKKLLPEACYPSSHDFDVTDVTIMNSFVNDRNFELMIHAAAFTSPPKCEADPVRSLDVNIMGTGNVVRLCFEHGIKLYYISTDYVFPGDAGNYRENDALLPVNKYAWSKLGGECAVRLYDKSLIIRTSFGPDSFPYEAAFADQWTSRQCVTEIASKIVTLIDKPIKGVIHVGGQRRTVFEYAKSLDPTRDIRKISIDDVQFNAPKDTSLDCSLFDLGLY